MICQVRNIEPDINSTSLLSIFPQEGPSIRFAIVSVVRFVFMNSLSEYSYLA